MSAVPVTEAELQAYVDGALSPARAAEIAEYLTQDETAAQRIAAFRAQNYQLHDAYDDLLIEPLPERLRIGQVPRRRAWYPYAAAALLMLASGTAGWHLHERISGTRTQTTQIARVAAMAHAVYSPEVRHPVEVGADQEEHLVRWLSKRLGASLKIPHLAPQGYALVGGRLLPGERGPAAQFMYQDAKGQRLTLYVRVSNDVRAPTAFRFAQENGVGVFYWLDGRLGYALSGETDRGELLRVADAVYQQLNP
jgi:anti-sigma factor RsiW